MAWAPGAHCSHGFLKNVFKQTFHLCLRLFDSILLQGAARRGAARGALGGIGRAHDGRRPRGRRHVRRRNSVVHGGADPPPRGPAAVPAVLLRQDAAAAVRGDLHLTSIRFRSVC